MDRSVRKVTAGRGIPGLVSDRMAEAERTPARDLVLVADDEAIVLRVITAALSNAGFRAEVVTGGINGLEKYRERRNEICLIVADVVMPEGSGIEMAQRIREIDPDVKILFMS